MMLLSLNKHIPRASGSKPHSVVEAVSRYHSSFGNNNRLAHVADLWSENWCAGKTLVRIKRKAKKNLK